MKKIVRLIASISLLSLMCLAVFAGTAPKAHAATPPVCYAPDFRRPITAAASATGQELPGSATVVDCATMSFWLALPVGPGGTALGSFKEDHCYVSEGYAFYELPPDQGVMTCANLAAWSGATAASPAKCYLFNDAKLDDFYRRNYDATKLSETSCTPDLIAVYLLNHSSQTTIPNGTCVVFNQPKNDSATQTCSELANIIAQTEKNVNNAAERATAATVGSECAPGDDCTGFSTVDCQDQNSCGFVAHVINPIIQFLAGGVGFVIIIVIIVGGIKYSSSAGDPQKAAAAQKMIMNAVIALVTYIFLYAILRWILPNGVI